MNEWIRVMVDLTTRPKFTRLRRLLKLDENAAVGAVVRAWSLAFSRADDGGRLAMRPADLDDHIGVKGFTKALCDPGVGWASVERGTIVFAEFEKHIGALRIGRKQWSDRQRRSRLSRHVTVTSCDKPSPSQSQSSSQSLPYQEGDARGRVFDASVQDPNPQASAGIPHEGADRSPPDRGVSVNGQKFPLGFHRGTAAGIWQEFPSDRRTGKTRAVLAIMEAVATIYGDRAHPGHTDPVGWLRTRIAVYAASPAAKMGRYSKQAPAWFEEGRYDDPDEAWSKGVARSDGPSAQRDRAPTLDEIRAMRERVHANRGATT